MKANCSPDSQREVLSRARVHDFYRINRFYSGITEDKEDGVQDKKNC